MTSVFISNPKYTTLGEVNALIKSIIESDNLSQLIINRLVVYGDLKNAVKYHNKLKQTKIYKLSINQVMKGEF